MPAHIIKQEIILLMLHRLSAILAWQSGIMGRFYASLSDLYYESGARVLFPRILFQGLNKSDIATFRGDRLNLG